MLVLFIYLFYYIFYVFFKIEYIMIKNGLKHEVHFKNNIIK